MTLNVTIKEFPTRHLTGVVVRTDMQKAETDVTALWQAWGPQHVPFPNNVNASEIYGVSIPRGTDGTFDYWIVVDPATGVPLPEDRKMLELPAGFYACAFAPNMEQFGATFEELYMEWQNQQSEYAVVNEAPCVEVYPNGWQTSDPFELQVLITNK